VIPEDYELLRDYALQILESVDFVKSPQLNLMMDKMIETFASQLAEAAINLPWEEWADDGLSEGQE